jgi:hypothetical protein
MEREKREKLYFATFAPIRDSKVGLTPSPNTKIHPSIIFTDDAPEVATAAPVHAIKLVIAGWFKCIVNQCRCVEEGGVP